MYGARGALEVASEAAAKLDASLNIKKKIDDSELPKAFFKNTDVLKIIQAEYSINHCTQAVRNLLCKGATQEKIREACDAYVSTKGRYIPQGPRTSAEKNDKAFGLYLFIQGPNKRSVDLAIKMIEHINQFGGDTRQPPPLMSLSTTAPPPSGTSVAGPLSAVAPPPQTALTTIPPPSLMNLVPLQGPPPSINLVEKVPIGIDRVLPGFNLPMKLIGQNGSNLHYIRNETGAIVTLRGIGSAFIEPTTGQEAQEILHFNIEHHKPEGIAAARDLALNLITTVQQEYAQFQTTQVAVPQLNMDPNLVIHQPGHIDQQLIQQPLLTTSIALPVMQTAASFLPQANVAPPPQFSQPPPAQLNLPPPGVHIPQQTGPLVPPPNHPSQQMQIHQPPPEPNTGLIQQQFQPGPQQQQQYLITQSGQPVQGIVTSQGFVVLNQQPQQVFLSQPPTSAPQIIHQGQLAFQHSGQAAVTTPVSYQLQYVQQNQPPSISGSPLHIQQQQQHPPQQSQIFFQPAGQIQFQNGTVQLAGQQQIVGEKATDGSAPLQQQLLPPGSQLVHMKPVQHTVQVMHQTQAPTVQYISSPGVRPEQPRALAAKEPRPGKRKFTEEAEAPLQPSSPQQQAQPDATPPNQHLMQHPPPPQHLLQSTQTQMIRITQPQPYVMHSQPLYNQPGQSPPCPQPVPVPHPNQAMQQLRQGVGVQDLLVQQREQQPSSKASTETSGGDSGKEGLDERQPPPIPAPGSNPYVTQDQTQKALQPNNWYNSDPNQKSDGNNTEDCSAEFVRRDRHSRERPTFNHYTGKPQLYGGGFQPYPPPPPPPPPQQHLSNFYYHRR